MHLEGNAKVVADLTRQALDTGLSLAEVLNGGLVAGMDRVGVDFRNGVLFVPEVLIAARAMHAGMAILRPLLAQNDVPLAGKVIIETVQGDLHDIGKNLVAMMLEGGSALLTTTMLAMKKMIDALVKAGLREKVKVMISGAPVTQAYADQIGADGYAPDAASAVELARSLVR